jgi:hypothetical protein
MYPGRADMLCPTSTVRFVPTAEVNRLALRLMGKYAALPTWPTAIRLCPRTPKPSVHQMPLSSALDICLLLLRLF